MSNNRRNDSTITRVAAGAAVGALLGLAAYGVKMLYDEFSPHGEQEESHVAAEKAKKLRDYDDSGDFHEDDSLPEASGSCHTPLHSQLDHYYKTYAKVPNQELSFAKQVVDDVKKTFLRFVQENLPEMRVVALMDTGSVAENLKVIHANEFDVMIHLEMEENMWMIEESETAPGYWNVKLRDGASSSYRRQCVGNNLSPTNMISRFQSILQKMVNAPYSKYDIRNSVHGPAITLNVTYSENGQKKNLDIDFVPAIEINSTWVVAKLHPQASAIPGYDNLWRQSFSFDEYPLFNQNPNLHLNSCHRKCLMIMKAVRLNHYAQLGPLSSYVLKTVLLHMLDQEDDWSDNVLSERVFDFMIALKKHLSDGNLPNYFCPDMNLLQGLCPATITGLRQFIVKRLDNKGIVSLLKTDYNC